MSSSNPEDVFRSLYGQPPPRDVGYRLTVNGLIIGEFRTIGKAYDRINAITPIAKVLNKNYFRYLWTRGIVAVEVDDHSRNVRLSYRIEKL